MAHSMALLVLLFVSSVELREGAHSSISSLQTELSLSSWLRVIVNNCDVKCNILGQKHVVCYEYSED